VNPRRALNYNAPMNTEEIIVAIDAEITRLEEARKLLNGTAARPKSAGGSGVGNGKRTMSAAGRARIAAAQKARWAKARK
jgi:hypothetical protein